MPRRINLIPRGERARTSTNVGMLAVVVAAIVVMFALALGYYMFTNTRSDRETELQQVQLERESLDAQVSALQAYERLAEQRRDKETVVQGIYAGRTLVAQLLGDVSLVVPDNAWFISLSMSVADPGALASDSGEVSGGSLSLEGNTYSFKDVARVLVLLQLIEALSNVDLESAGAAIGDVDPNKGVKGFSIGAVVNNTQKVDAPLPLSQVEVEGP
jgi:Tfp pilus assembly protein PilN